MNCANHPDRERAAFCQNCGKPLCSECIRNIGNSVFCEPCFASRQTAASGSYHGYPPVYPPPPVSGEPNPGLAALLGFIPGVGAMYNEQYAKGIVHLIVFALLISLAHENGIFGLFIMGWILYMVIEAHHTARARRDGTPLPNPFGLNDISERLGFGRAWPSPSPQNPNPTGSPYSAATPPEPSAQDPSAQTPPGATSYPPPNPNPYNYTYVPPVTSWTVPPDPYASTPYTSFVPPVPPMPSTPPYPDPNLSYQRRFPTAAIWLIALGLLFLFGNIGFFHFIGARFLGPLLLICVGVWIFVRKMTSTGQSLEDDGTPAYRWRLEHAIRCSMWVFLVGILWLLDVLHILSWSHSWPLFLIAGGVMLFLKHNGGYGYGPGYPGYPPAPPPTPPPATTSIVPAAYDASVDPHGHNGDQEGR